MGLVNRIRQSIRLPFCLGLVIALLATMPSAAATGSGGWNSLGHGKKAADPALSGKVETFTNVGSTLYVGGDFINAGGLAEADHIATWDGHAWGALGGGLGDSPSAVYAIAVDPVTGTVFAGGSFVDAGGDVHADEIAKFDGTSWSSLASVGLNGPVFALSIVGRTLYVGGGFSDVNGDGAADAVAAYQIDGGGWSPITDSSGDIGGTVCCLVPDGSGGLYVGGSFLNADGIATADFLARYLGGTSWSDVGGTSAINNRVRAIAVSGPDLYVGGDFTNVGGDLNADKVARWDGSSWSALGGASAFGDVATSVYALTVDQSTVFAAGYFNNADGNAKIDGVGAFTDGSWTNVGTNGDGTNGPVPLNTLMTTLRVVGSKLYLGGLASSIGGSTKNGYAAWYRLRQPDAQIAVAGGRFVGNGVYNTSGQKQERLQTVHPGKTASFSVKVTNDGLAADSVSLKGTGSAGDYQVTYLAGATNISAQVVAGTYVLDNLARGASRTITMKVKVAGTAALGHSRSFLVTATSSGAGLPKDTVRATVKVK